MPYNGQFEFFDPLNGTIAPASIPYLHSVVLQARLMLQRRSSDQIKLLAVNIDIAIRAYYAQVNEPANKTSAEPLTDYTYELHALQRCVDDWDDLGDGQIPNLLPYETYCVLALWLAADAVGWIRAGYEITVGARMSGQENLSLDAALTAIVRTELAAESAMQALDAVRFAQLDAHRDISTMLKREVETELHDVKKKKSMATAKMNIAREQRREEAQTIVLGRWRENTSEFRSAEKAGNEFSPWLAKQGFEFEPRTITTWIRAYAKEKGIKLR